VVRVTVVEICAEPSESDATARESDRIRRQIVEKVRKTTRERKSGRRRRHGPDPSCAETNTPRRTAKHQTASWGGIDRRGADKRLGDWAAARGRKQSLLDSSGRLLSSYARIGESGNGFADLINAAD